jgi:hypothetical protein
MLVPKCYWRYTHVFYKVRVQSVVGLGFILYRRSCILGSVDTTSRSSYSLDLHVVQVSISLSRLSYFSFNFTHFRFYQARCFESGRRFIISQPSGKISSTSYPEFSHNAGEQQPEMTTLKLDPQELLAVWHITPVFTAKQYHSPLPGEHIRQLSISLSLMNIDNRYIERCVPQNEATC